MAAGEVEQRQLREAWQETRSVPGCDASRLLALRDCLRVCTLACLTARTRPVMRVWSVRSVCGDTSSEVAGSVQCPAPRRSSPARLFGAD